MSTQDQDDDVFAFLLVVGIGIMATLGTMLGVRIYNKAGADIQAATAQARIATVLEHYMPQRMTVIQAPASVKVEEPKKAAEDSRESLLEIHKSYYYLCKRLPPVGAEWVTWLRLHPEACGQVAYYGE